MNGHDDQPLNRQDAKNAKIEPEKELDALAHAVIGAAIEVHRLLGPGYLESVYQKALEIELQLRGIAFKPRKPITLLYKSHNVGKGSPDFVVGDVLLVELKAVEALAPIHKAQVISYLKATNLHLGLLINFNTTVLKDGIKRIILS
jgi:GxxExxY protein